MSPELANDGENAKRSLETCDLPPQVVMFSVVQAIRSTQLGDRFMSTSSFKAASRDFDCLCGKRQLAIGRRFDLRRLAEQWGEEERKHIENGGG
jgi:hypothetical protein